MFGTYSFESFTQDFTIDSDLEVSSQSSRYEVGFDSGFQFELANETTLVSQVGLPVTTLFSSRQMSFGEASIVSNSQQVSTNGGGISLWEETSNVEWQAGGLTSSTSQRDITIEMGEMQTNNLMFTEELTSISPSINVQSQTMELSNELGQFSIANEVTSVAGGPTMVTRATEWSLETPLSGIRMQGSSTAIQMESAGEALLPESQPENQWIQQTVETSFSLEMPLNPLCPRSLNQSGMVAGGMEVTQTSNSISMGPGQLSLQTQQTDVFAQFAGGNIAAQWLGQSQTGVDLSLAIA